MPTLVFKETSIELEPVLTNIKKNRLTPEKYQMTGKMRKSYLSSKRVIDLSR